MKFLLLICLSYILSSTGLFLKNQNLQNNECSVSVNGGLTEPQPLFIIPGTQKLLLTNNREGIIRLKSGEMIEMFCTTSFEKPFDETTLMNVTCEEGTFFTVKEKTYNFTEFSCNAYPRHIARRTEKFCHGDAIIVEIGFEVEKRFFHLMDVCHNVALASNLYVRHLQDERNDGFQRSFPRQHWVTGGFYPGLSIDSLYTRAQQERTFTQILGSQEIAANLVGVGNRFLSRGHMSAKVDYIFGLHQRATFYFLNASPQWQNFNAGNWESIEDGVRSFVANKNISIEIYTGTYGVMEVKDINNKPQELYLFVDEKNNRRAVPVPKIFYRLLYNPVNNSGLVIIGVNNPHINLEEIKLNYIFCDDISDKITWINWRKDDLNRGYSYACEANQFIKFVNHLPDNINITSLLI